MHSQKLIFGQYLIPPDNKMCLSLFFPRPKNKPWWEISANLRNLVTEDFHRGPVKAWTVGHFMGQ